MLAMPGCLALLAPGMRDDASIFAMAVEFGRITFPYLLFISLASLYGGVLNSIDRFAHVAATPILLNLALIGAVLGLTPLLPNAGYAASIGVAIAGLLQWLWLLIACARDGVGMKLVRPRWTERVARLVQARHAGGDRRRRAADQHHARRGLGLAAAGRHDLGALLRRPHRPAAAGRGRHRHRHGAAAAAGAPAARRPGRAAMANQNRAIEFGLLFSLPAAAGAVDAGRAHDPRAVRARPLRARRHVAHRRRAGGLRRRPAGLRAGQGADAGLLRPRGHAHAALYRDRRRSW